MFPPRPIQQHDIVLDLDRQEPLVRRPHMQTLPGLDWGNDPVVGPESADRWEPPTSIATVVEIGPACDADSCGGEAALMAVVDASSNSHKPRSRRALLALAADSGSTLYGGSGRRDELRGTSFLRGTGRSKPNSQRGRQTEEQSAASQRVFQRHQWTASDRFGQEACVHASVRSGWARMGRIHASRSPGWRIGRNVTTSAS
jgi:hypothetical protein